jgi:hypothetical protein
MSSNAGISCGPDKWFPLLKLDMLTKNLKVLGDPEIDYVYLIAVLIPADQKVFRFYIPMNYTSFENDNKRVYFVWIFSTIDSN